MPLLAHAPDLDVVVKCVMKSHAISQFVDDREGTLHDGDRVSLIWPGRRKLFLFLDIWLHANSLCPSACRHRH